VEKEEKLRLRQKLDLSERVSSVSCWSRPPIFAKGHYANRIGSGAPVYLAAALEYLSAEILELAGNAARDNE
jgi:hypothetical protein